jgi:hypothetical protein
MLTKFTTQILAEYYRTSADESDEARLPTESTAKKIALLIEFTTQICAADRVYYANAFATTSMIQPCRDFR